MKKKKEVENDFFKMLGQVVENGKKEVERILKDIEKNKYDIKLKTIEYIQPNKNKKNTLF